MMQGVVVSMCVKCGERIKGLALPSPQIFRLTMKIWDKVDVIFVRI